MALISAVVDAEVPFHHIDAMNVAWHGHYLQYFELARAALLRRLDYDYPQMRESGYFWPVVECRIKYVKPARYGQQLRIKASLAEYLNRMRIDYLVADAATGKRMTTGFTLQVAVHAATGELQFVSPAALLERIERACAAGSP